MSISERENFWKEELEKLKASGLSRSQYCRDNGINYYRFGYWLKRLSSLSPIFVPVKVQEPDVRTIKDTLCTVELGKHNIKIHDLSVLSFLLERLT